ncbi:MAG: YncE family protein [Planctomycetota bacterium]|nr:YncE family protein [Planctomycetota bacterium]
MTLPRRFLFAAFGLVCLGAASAVEASTARRPSEGSRTSGAQEDTERPLSAEVAPSATGSLLVVSADEHALVVQEPATGERSAFFRVGISPNAVAVSPDGRTAVVTNRGERISGTTISVVDLRGTDPVRTIPLVVPTRDADRSVTSRSYHRPSGVTFLPGGRRVLVTCAIEGVLLMVDLVEARVVGHVELEAEGPQDVVIDHDGAFAYVANRASGTVSVIELGRMRLVRAIDAGGGPSGMALHPFADEIWVTNAYTNSISIIDLETRNERTEIACGAMPVDVCFTPDGAHALVTNMQEGDVSVFDVETLRIERLIELDRVSEDQAKTRPVSMPGRFGLSPLPTRVITHPDGDLAWISTRRDDRLYVVETNTWTVVASQDAPHAPADLGWSRVTTAPAANAR